MKYLSWASDLLKAYILKNAAKVVYLVKESQIDNLRHLKSFQNTCGEIDGRLYQISDQKLKKYFVQFLSSLLHYLRESKDKSDPSLTFSLFKDATVAFLGIFKSDISQGKWIAEIVTYFCSQLLSLAHQSDKVNPTAKEKAYDVTARILRDFFAACQTLKEDVSNSRVVSALPIINTLFKIYFRRNILRQSIGLTRWVQQGMVPLERFNRQDIITYHFYAGRIAMLEGNFLKAEELLEAAFLHTPARFFKNKRLSLRYLIPIKIYLGTYASPALIQKYKLEEYKKIVGAIREGNLKLFDEEVSKWQAFYIKQGLYVQIEKLRSITMRNLLRFTITCSAEKVQVDLGLIYEVFKEAGGEEQEDLQLDEAEALIANLMFKGWVKGYLSHEKRKVVFSKALPFPKLRDVVAQNPDLHN